MKEVAAWRETQAIEAWFIACAVRPGFPGDGLTLRRDGRRNDRLGVALFLGTCLNGCHGVASRCFTTDFHHKCGPRCAL